MGQVKITVDEWWAELEALSRQNDQGLTTAEWADKMGVSREIMLSRLKVAKANGWLRKGTAIRERFDGRPQPADVYWIEKPHAKRKGPKL